MSNPIIVDPGFTDGSQAVLYPRVPVKSSWTDFWTAAIPTPLQNGIGLMLAVLLDGFVRADTAAGVLGNADIGGAWGAVTSAHISSHKMISTVTGTSIAAKAVNRAVDLVEVNFAWAATSGGSIDDFLNIDLTDGLTVQNGIRLHITHSLVQVYTVASGAQALHIGDFNFTAAADGAANKMQFWINGSTITGIQNGAAMIGSPLTDGAIATARQNAVLNWGIVVDASVARAISVSSVGAFIYGDNGSR